MTGSIRPAMQISILGVAAFDFSAPRGPRNRPFIFTRRQRGKNRIEMLHDFRLASDHLTVSALEAEHPAAGARINVVYPFGLQCLGAIDIIRSEEDTSELPS